MTSCDPPTNLQAHPRAPFRSPRWSDKQWSYVSNTFTRLIAAHREAWELESRMGIAAARNETEPQRSRVGIRGEQGDGAPCGFPMDKHSLRPGRGDPDRDHPPRLALFQHT